MPPSFLAKYWKPFIFFILFVMFGSILLGIVVLFVECSCVGGTFLGLMPRGFNNESLNRPGTDQTPTQPGTGGTVEKDCIKKINPRASQYVDKVNEAAKLFGTDPALMMAQLEAESSFNPNARSDIKDPKTGKIIDHAYGISQFIPSTWSYITSKYNVDGNGNGTENYYEAEDGIYAQAAYNVDLQNTLGSLGTTENILAAYNAGPGAVQKYNGIPPYSETIKYVNYIMKRYQKYKQCLESQTAQPSTNINQAGLHYPLGNTKPLLDPFTGGREFKADRNNGRYHAGVDLVTNEGASVYAIKDGKIVNYYQFTPPPSNLNTTYCIFVDHGDFVVNYGEVSGMTQGLKIGDTVKAGQVIGNVGKVTNTSAMLHFEMYTPGTIQNISWRKTEAKPPQLIDPTSFLKSFNTK